jgi:hypothetical protein
MQRLQQLLDELIDAGAAGVVMHYHDQNARWRGSSGVAELGTDRPVDPDAGSGSVASPRRSRRRWCCCW